MHKTLRAIQIQNKLLALHYTIVITVIKQPSNSTTDVQPTLRLSPAPHALGSCNVRIPGHTCGNSPTYIGGYWATGPFGTSGYCAVCGKFLKQNSFVAATMSGCLKHYEDPKAGSCYTCISHNPGDKVLYKWETGKSAVLTCEVKVPDGDCGLSLAYSAITL